MAMSDEGSTPSARSPSLVPQQDEHEHDQGEDEESWTNHTISMRRALKYCRRLLQTAQPKRSTCMHNIDAVAAAARNLQRGRKIALRDFWGSSPSPTIQTISDPSPIDFRRNFLHANVPCKIRGLEAHFGGAATNWTHQEKGSSSTIHREWFLTHIGEDTHVPVRHQQPQQPKYDGGPPSNAQLDEDGRAVECETLHIPLQRWIDMLDDADATDVHEESNSTSVRMSTHQSPCDPSYYLKDWHLVAWLAQHAAEQLPLYRVPPIFSYDLLNGFLSRHTTGDYRFVYWGPANSTTELHSDVLNSYSWSYNVCGCKEWTFYPPSCSVVPSDEFNHPQLRDDPAAAVSIVVLQQAGECMFVPAGWKHRVVNTEETLSINHNWITTSNLSLTWNCLQTEMRAIEGELTAWGIAADCWDARENMLLGCVGLDVTSFFLMILSRALELLQQDLGDVDDDWGVPFDLVCLGDLLSQLLGDEALHAYARLAATLLGDTPAALAIEMAKTTLNMIDLAK
jgi:hypothetical protein